jgi:hypothetical protein
MTMRTRPGIAMVGYLLAALLGAGCGLNLDFNRDLQSPPSQDPPTDDARMCAAVIPEATPEYEAMCRSYCDALEETLTYAGSSGGAPGAVSQSCYELRCVPRCVTYDTCLQQCHALGVQYQSVCVADGIGSEAECPGLIQERVDHCLAGCALWVPPPGPPPPPKPGSDVGQVR